MTDAAPDGPADPSTPSDPSTARLRIVFPDQEAAETARAALAPDNDGHLEATVEGAHLVLVAASESVMGLLRSLDDALGCVRALGEP